MTLSALPWDQGIRWRTQATEEFSDLPLPLDYVRDQVLRVFNDTVEDMHITELIYAALDAAETMTDRAIMPRTWTQTMTGFPTGRIVLQRPPLIEVTSVQYYDSDNELTTWDVSPSEYLITPSGRDSKAEISLVDGASWPTVYARHDAVTITFRAGYINENVSPPEYPIPHLIKQGMCVHIAEQYKQRSLGVINVQFSPATLQLQHFWKKVY